MSKPPSGTSNREFEPIKYTNPIISAYKSSADLARLKDWFYNFTPNDNRSRAINQTKAIASRGKIPHGVESTALLTSTFLQDNAGADSYSLSLAYTMALIRFVNGLLDPLQKSQFATPMHILAKNLDLPAFFVEIRHMGTHESLPSLELCRTAAHRAMNWLYDHYWSQIDTELQYYRAYEVSESQLQGIDPIDPIETRVRSLYNDKLNATHLVAHLKSYKKIRKSNLDATYTPPGTKQNVVYWKLVREIKKVGSTSHFLAGHPALANRFSGSDLLVSVLVYSNFLLYNASKIAGRDTLKFNPLTIKLYRPLLQELGAAFRIKLFLHLCAAVLRSNSNDNTDKAADGFVVLGCKFKHPFETVQSLEWLAYLAGTFDSASEYPYYIFPDWAHYADISTRKVSGYTAIKSHDAMVAFLVNALTVTYNKAPAHPEIYLKILTAIRTNTPDKITTETTNKIDSLTRRVNYVADFNKFKAPPSLDELLASSKRPSPTPEPPAKRPNVSNSSKRLYLLEPHPNWKPVPFGVPI